MIESIGVAARPAAGAGDRFDRGPTHSIVVSAGCRSVAGRDMVGGSLAAR
jgi:hypothetical protein